MSDESTSSSPQDREARQFIVRDARGREVTQIDPVALRMFRRHDVIAAEILGEIAAEIGSGLTKRHRQLLYLFFIAGGISGLILLISSIELLVTGRAQEISGGRAVVFSQIWGWPFLLWVIAKRRRHGRTLRVLLKHRRCPHCGYDLRGLPVSSEDGATVCPECGCAWQLPTAPT